MRLLHVSDTHLGYMSGSRHDLETGRNVRTLDFERAWLQVCARAAEPDVDLVIHSGDAFHHPRPSYASIRTFIDGLAMIKAPVVVIGGNHDTPRLRLTSSPFMVTDAALPKVRWVTGYEERAFQVGEAKVFCVPWARLMDPRPLEPSLSSGMNILVSHGDLPNGPFASAEPGHGCVPERLLVMPWTYVAMGHIHIRQEPYSDVWYAGSTERCGWTDAPGTPGYLIVDIDGTRVSKVTVETTRHRPFIDLGERSLDELEELKSPESVARVRFPGVTRADARQVLARARRERWFLDLRADLDEPGPIVIKGVPVQGPLNIRQMLDDFIELRNMSEDIKEIFMKRGHEVLAQAEAEEASQDRVD